MSHPYSQQYFKRSFGDCVIDRNREILEESRLNKLVGFVDKINDIKILDLGCGPGYFLSICEKKNWLTFGVDISDYALVKASENSKAKITVVNINNEVLPFEDNYFDVIASFDVLEHLQGDTIYFSEIKRVLKKGGVAIISTPDGKSPHDKEGTHINIYLKEDLIKKIESFGFKVLAATENRGYVKRIIPLRRYPMINWLNQRLCDVVGWYVKEVMIVMQK